MLRFGYPRHRGGHDPFDHAIRRDLTHVMTRIVARATRSGALHDRVPHGPSPQVVAGMALAALVVFCVAAAC